MEEIKLLQTSFKKDALMRILLILLLLSLGVIASDKRDTNNLSLDLRSVYVNYNYDRGFDNAEAFVTSAKIKYEQKFLDDFTFGLALATVQDLGILNDDLTKRNMTYIFDKDNKNFSILHQIYLQYNYSKSFIEVGRFELETPLISSGDTYVLANTFEGIHFDIKEFENYNFRVGYLSRMSGSWDSRYDGGTFNSMTKQAWAHRADNGKEIYYQLVGNGTSPIGLGARDAGLGYIGLAYEKEGLKLQFYDHILFDAYNSLFAQIDYEWDIDNKKLLVAGQYIAYDGIGALENNSNTDTVVNYATYSAKTKLSIEDLSIQLAYTGVTDTGSIHFFGAHGGFPQFASGMMVSYFETSLRDANLYSLSSSYKFGTQKHAFDFTALYAYYDLNSDYTKNGIIGDSINGDDYLHTYGLSGKYTFDEKISWSMKLAQRRLEHGDKSLLFRTILKYTF